MRKGKLKLNNTQQQPTPRTSSRIPWLRRRPGNAALFLPVALLLLSSATSISAFLVNPRPSLSSAMKRPLAARAAAAVSTSTTSPMPSTASVLDNALPLPPIQKQTLLELGTAGLEDVLEGKGRARMVWRAVREGLDPYESNPDAPLFDERITTKTRSLLQGRVQPPHWTVAKTTRSPCGTVKLLVRLHDGLMVESVVIPSTDKTANSNSKASASTTASRSTVCVSSQVGCAQACAFCLTGMMGFIRHLSVDEILMQLQLALQVAREDGLPDVRNVVFMGMGEPLNNPHAVSQALEAMTDAHGFALSPNFVTVSTVAPSPAHVRRFLDMPKAKIAWSVHGATDKMRRALVPTTSATMVELREAFREVMAQRGDTDIFIECTLIDGVNDALADAEALVEFLRPFGKEGVKINLIPYNDTGVNGWKPSPWETILAFQAHVRTQGGWPTFVRTPRGRGESSACGQLATEVAARGAGGGSGKK